MTRYHTTALQWSWRVLEHRVDLDEPLRRACAEFRLPVEHTATEYRVAFRQGQCITWPSHPGLEAFRLITTAATDAARRNHHGALRAWAWHAASLGADPVRAAERCTRRSAPPDI